MPKQSVAGRNLTIALQWYDASLASKFANCVAVCGRGVIPRIVGLILFSLFLAAGHLPKSPLTVRFSVNVLASQDLDLVAG